MTRPPASPPVARPAVELIRYSHSSGAKYSFRATTSLQCTTMKEPLRVRITTSPLGISSRDAFRVGNVGFQCDAAQSNVDVNDITETPMKPGPSPNAAAYVNRASVRTKLRTVITFNGPKFFRRM